MRQLQHGDVIIREIGTLPQGGIIVEREDGRIVLARGEATGHHHAIAERTANLYSLKGDFYLEVRAPVTITHEEHKPMTVPTGIYAIGQVVEYDHLAQLQRQVVD